MAGAIGTLARLGIGDASPTTYGLDFRSEGLRMRQDSVNGNGTRGTFSHTVERVRAGLKKIEGPLSLQPNAADYHQLWPWILGAAGSVISGTQYSYPLGNATTGKFVQIDRIGKVFTYSGVAVNGFRLAAEQGALVDLELDLVAIDETVGNAGTFPAIYADVTTAPFILSDLTLSVNSTTVTAKNFEVSGEFDIDKDRFFNSNTLSATLKRDRNIMFKTNLPYGDFVALYNTGAANGVAVLATLTNGSVEMVLSMQKVVFAPMSPVVEGRVEVMLPLEGRAYRHGTQTDATKNELIVTLDTGV